MWYYGSIDFNNILDFKMNVDLFLNIKNRIGYTGSTI